MRSGGGRKQGGDGNAGESGSGDAGDLGSRSRRGPRECGRGARPLTRRRDRSVALARSGPGVVGRPALRVDVIVPMPLARRAGRFGGAGSRPLCGVRGRLAGWSCVRGARCRSRASLATETHGADRIVQALDRRAPNRARGHEFAGDQGGRTGRAGRRPRRPRACRGPGSGPGVHAVFATRRRCVWLPAAAVSAPAERSASRSLRSGSA